MYKCHNEHFHTHIFMLKIISLDYFETIGLKGTRELAIMVAFPTSFQVDFPKSYQFTALP